MSVRAGHDQTPWEMWEVSEEVSSEAISWSLVEWET